MSDLARNLSLLAAHRRSVSELCRELGFNRQQFARYLSGEARPSAFNLKRIAQGFGLEVSELQTPHELFAKQYGTVSKAGTGLPFLDQAFPGDLRKLRPLLGYYHSHWQVPGTPGSLFRSLVLLQESNGRVTSHSIERRSNRDTATGYISKYRGLASYLGNCVFVVEFECLSKDSIVETILFPPYRKALDTMTGMTFGVTSRVHRQPFSSAVIWKFLGVAIEPRKALDRCGRISLEDRGLDPAVRRFFNEGAGSQLASTGPV